MSMLQGSQREAIEAVIKACIRRKFEKYDRETKRMPFHDLLLGKYRMATFSFVQSLNTSFGTSIFEPIAEKLARSNFPDVRKQFTVGNSISMAAQNEIQDIINGLTAGNGPDKLYEIKRIREVCRRGKMGTLKPMKADLRVRSHGGAIYLFDLKTAKPNKGGFKEFKRMLLEWAAIVLAQEPKAEVHTIIAMPYNPYEPKRYEHWAAKGILDFQHELMVAAEFWDFLVGGPVYDDLLCCFKRAEIELRKEIDDYFACITD